jgi:Zn-dependent peptidase ImmA (M78 family)
MSIWSEIRKQARLCHDKVSASGASLPTAEDLLAAAEEHTGIHRQKLPPNDALLDGADAIYNPDHKCIYYSAATDPVLARFHIAHEYAHPLLSGYKSNRFNWLQTSPKSLSQPIS